MTVYEKPEVYGFIHENIELHIKLIADSLEKGITELSIIQFYESQDYRHDDILDILAAGKLLYQARVSAPPKKTLIRRIP